MKNFIKPNKKDFIEYLLFIVFVIITLTLHTFQLDGLMTLTGFLFIIAITLICILNHNHYSIKTKEQQINELMFILSLITKIMVLLAFVFTKAKYPGKEIIYLIASLISLVYIIICIVKKNWKETIVMLVYRESLTIFCFSNLIGHME